MNIEVEICPICGEPYDRIDEAADHGQVCVEERLSAAEALRLQQALSEAPDFVLGL